MMTADRIRSLLVTAYMVLFFSYLFLPLIIMTAATFNTSTGPTESVAIIWPEMRLPIGMPPRKATL